MKLVQFYLFLCLMAAAPNALASVASEFGMGPLSSGLGGTSLFQGRPHPYQVYSAPASLGFIKRVELSVGAQYMDPRLRPFGTLVISPTNGNLGEFREAGVLPGGGTVLGIALPLGKVRPLTFGGTIYLPFSTLIRVSGSPVNYPYYPLYTDISRNFFFVIGAGYEILDGLAFGVNVRSTTKSTAYYLLRSDNSVSYSASAVEAKGQSRLSFSLLYDNEKRNSEKPFTVGFMYRAKAGLETKLSADIQTAIPLQGELNSLPAFMPAEWVFMGTIRVFQRWTISGDLAWVKWSKFSSPYGSGNINSYVIGSSRKEAGFRDIPVYRFGVDHSSPQSGKIQKLSYRLGYSFQKSPVPDQTQDSNFVDNDRHGITGGLGMQWKNPWQDDSAIDLDLFFQYNLLKRRQISKDAANRIGSPGYLTGGKILLYGAGATIRF